MSYECAQLGVPGLPVREEEEFVVGVELHEVPAGLPLPADLLKSVFGGK